MIKSSPLVCSMYKFLLYNQPGKVLSARDQIEQVRALRKVFMHEESYELMELCARPGSYLYGEYMKMKMDRIRSKISSGGGITF